MTTQAAEKFYRSLGRDCRNAVELRAASGSWLERLPQETILFERARLQRTARVDCASESRVLAGEMLVFGRRAHGETLTRGRFRDAWEVRRDGRLVWAEALAADGDLTQTLTAPFCLAGAAALATLLYIGAAMEEALAFARDFASKSTGGDLLVAATCVAGLLVVRWIGKDVRALRAAFGRFWAAFRHRVGGWTKSLPRVLDPGLMPGSSDARSLDRGSPTTNLGHAPTADKSQLNRRPCFLPSTLGADMLKYHLQKQEGSVCLSLDITDMRTRISHRGRCIGPRNRDHPFVTKG